MSYLFLSYWHLKLGYETGSETETRVVIPVQILSETVHPQSKRQNTIVNELVES